MAIDGSAKALAAVPVLVVTGIWVIIGGIVPCCIRGPNKRLIQTMLVMTAVCCWLFWVCAYFCQLNPLIGPEIEAGALKAAVKEWGGKDV